MAKYFLSNKAVEDLSEIWGYTYDVWSENQADKYYEIILDACKVLSESPEIGKVYPEIEDEILGFRVNKHIIFYRIAAPNEIEVLRILHGRMDLKSKVEE